MPGKYALGHKSVNFILATGGPAIIRLAYTAGKPAIGVGPGNGSVLVDESADLRTAVASIVMSKTFDNGMICAAENSCVVVDHGTLYQDFISLLIERGCYICSPDGLLIV